MREVEGELRASVPWRRRRTEQRRPLGARTTTERYGERFCREQAGSGGAREGRLLIDREARLERA
jgi:hypothetical protein